MQGGRKGPTTALERKTQQEEERGKDQSQCE